MLIQRALLLVAAFCAIFYAAEGATKPKQLTRFRPISQAEYEAILNLTDGKPVVSEGRLINSGLAALAGLTSGWATNLRLPNFLAFMNTAAKSTRESYPLCVVKANEKDHVGHHDYHEHNNDEHHYHEYDDHAHHNHEHHRRSDDSNESSEQDYEHYIHVDHSNEYDSGEHHSSQEVQWHTNKLAPVVNCIVVVKKDEKQDYEEQHEHTTTKRPKRPKQPHKKHKKYRPPPPLHTAGYPYHAASSIYPVEPPTPPGSYNNPWYWQSPYYHPYYSNPRVYTDIYPAAFRDFYATTNPGAYPSLLPSTFPSNFATPSPSNNPNAYYDSAAGAYTDAATSTNPRNPYDSQSGSYTSDYSSLANAIVTHNFYNPSSDPSDMQPEEQITYPKQRKVPQSPIRKDTATRKHTKAKRDEPSTQSQSQSYAKIASYMESGYQPTLYPQNSYQSNYPKASYTHALPYPAPVYVRNSIEQPSVAMSIKKHQLKEADSEENDDSAEFIQVRNNY